MNNSNIWRHTRRIQSAHIQFAILQPVQSSLPQRADNVSSHVPQFSIYMKWEGKKGQQNEWNNMVKANASAPLILCLVEAWVYYILFFFLFKFIIFFKRIVSRAISANRKRACPKYRRRRRNENWKLYFYDMNAPPPPHGLALLFGARVRVRAIRCMHAYMHVRASILYINHGRRCRRPTVDI